MVSTDDPFYNTYFDIKELPKHIFDEIKNFFDVYKNLEASTLLTGEVEGASEAKKEIQRCIDLYKKKNN